MHVLRTRRLCSSLQDFKKTYYSQIGSIKQDYPADGVPSHKFIDYALEKYGKVLLENKKSLEVEIADLCIQGFFNNKAPGYWISPGGTIVQENSFLDLGWKGRKILQWWYLPEFLFEEHRVFAGFLFAIITSPVWLKVFKWIMMIIDKIMEQ